MIRVKVYRDGDPIHKIDLRKTEFIVGREGSAEVQLASAAVSRRHARITKTPDGWQVADLGAANGVYVSHDGGEPERIVIRTLVPGDVVIIETFSIKLTEIDDGEAAGDDAGATFEDENSLETKRTQFISMVDVLEATDRALVAPVSGEGASEEPAPAPRPSPAVGGATWWARLVSASGHDRVFTLAAPVVSVGADAKCEIQLPSGPNQIARLEREGPAISLERTAKWPFPRIVVDGESVKSAILSDGDSFAIGDLEVTLHLGAAPGKS